MATIRSPKSKQPTPVRLRSEFLLKESRGKGSEPFRHNYTMQFPAREQRALAVLASLLLFKEDYFDEYFPLFRGSHNLAHVQAAILDLHSVAKALACVAANVDHEMSSREFKAALLADRYALRVARLAAELRTAMDEIAPPKKSRAK